MVFTAACKDDLTRAMLCFAKAKQGGIPLVHLDLCIIVYEKQSVGQYKATQQTFPTLLFNDPMDKRIFIAFLRIIEVGCKRTVI